jgi:hypothetical protein
MGTCGHWGLCSTIFYFAKPLHFYVSLFDMMKKEYLLYVAKECVN